MFQLTSLRGLSAIGLVASGLGVSIIGGGFNPPAGSLAAAVAGAPAPLVQTPPPAVPAAVPAPTAPPAAPVVAAAPTTPTTAVVARTDRAAPPANPPIQPRRSQSQPGSGAPGNNGQPLQSRRPVSPLAAYLGLTDFQLQIDLSQGQTLNQIAQAQGKSPADLKTFLLGQLKVQYDQAVTIGRINSQQEDALLSQASAQLDQMMSANLANQISVGGGEGRGRGGGDQFRPANGQPSGVSSDDGD